MGNLNVLKSAKRHCAFDMILLWIVVTSALHFVCEPIGHGQVGEIMEELLIIKMIFLFKINICNMYSSVKLLYHNTLC